ncbi:MAG: branched-chain amino acid ABC transporter permease [Pseudomonadota bacterium]|nr:branched-chain amino acid ABC transporter permease [Pseudomonadota bacterium]
MTDKERRNVSITAVVFIIVALLPLADNGYWLSIGTSVAMFTVLATSWALFSGPTNYISLATAAFFGVGMYVVAAGIDVLPYPMLVILAGLAGAVLAFVVGLATLRISGVYFVIFTLGLAELIRQVMTWGQSTMGKAAGLYVLTDATEPRIYWSLVALAALVFLTGWWIGRSRLGFALRIIGNDEVVAVHAGINTARAKVYLFVISAVFASLAGALVAPRWNYVEPTLAFSPFISFQVVIMALLGGAHRLWGPLVGVIPFTIIWELINVNFPAQTTLLLGVAFLAIVYFIPHGVVGILEDARQKRIPARD